MSEKGSGPEYPPRGDWFEEEERDFDSRVRRENILTDEAKRHLYAGKLEAEVAQWQATLKHYEDQERKFEQEEGADELRVVRHSLENVRRRYSVFNRVLQGGLSAEDQRRYDEENDPATRVGYLVALQRRVKEKTWKIYQQSRDSSGRIVDKDKVLPSIRIGPLNSRFDEWKYLRKGDVEKLITDFEEFESGLEGL